MKGAALDEPIFVDWRLLVMVTALGVPALPVYKLNQGGERCWDNLMKLSGVHHGLIQGPTCIIYS